MKHVISGQDLIDAGMRQGKWFAPALEAANTMLADGASFDTALQKALSFAPPPTVPLKAAEDVNIHINILAENRLEQDNVEKVIATMRELARTPVVKSTAVLPDACPAGPIGIIPVGGVAASEAIHPGMHSADICCSVAISTFPGVAPKALLDAVHGVTHFGPGGRARGSQIRPSEALLEGFSRNRFLAPDFSVAIEHFATQGDGNHFAFVGTLRSTGETALVTHHGSRGPGAKLYARGMKLANEYRQMLSPETMRENAWIPADTPDGDAYWAALQLIRTWTKENHYKIHDLAAASLSAKVADRFWNEHNFVFRKSDGLFYHAKGATPAFDGWAEDATDFTLIPLNMAEPVLITRGGNADHSLGFSPHGAGRNFSRTQHKRMKEGRSEEDIFREETQGIDARFFSGELDISELPSAYKNAENVRSQINHFTLAEVVDEVLPYGSIMAGDWQKNAPWKRRRERR